MKESETPSHEHEVDKGKLTAAKSFKIRYGGLFTLINFTFMTKCFTCPPMQHNSFFRNYLSLFIYEEEWLITGNLKQC